jgi:SAM-dependent methyltransferase
MDPKRIVAEGYDQIAETYTAWVERGGSRHRDSHLAILEAELPDGARVLDLGCGAGIPVARRLAERFEVTGVDISERQIVLARRNVPGATFIHGDMAAQAFPQASFDAVVAFFSLIHVPRDEHGSLFRAIAAWLRPGGYLVASTGARSDPGTVEEDWLGAPMFWSFYPSAVSLEMIRASGLDIIRGREEVTDEDGQPATFLWLVARKPSEGNEQQGAAS